MKYKCTNPDNVLMVRENLDDLPQYEFAQGYYTRSYQPGDMNKWIDIQTASNPDSNFSRERFEAAYDHQTQLLPGKMLLLCDQQGSEIGTATAWFENEDTGLVHWVAIVPEYQGIGLGKSLVASVLSLLRQIGYKSCILRTKPSKTVGINLYLKFGFKPYIESDKDLEKWQLVKDIFKQKNIDAGIIEKIMNNYKAKA